jgi:hypothetical protein
MMHGDLKGFTLLQCCAKRFFVINYDFELGDLKGFTP